MAIGVHRRGKLLSPTSRLTRSRRRGHHTAMTEYHIDYVVDDIRLIVIMSVRRFAESAEACLRRKHALARLVVLRQQIIRCRRRHHATCHHYFRYHTASGYTATHRLSRIAGITVITNTAICMLPRTLSFVSRRYPSAGISIIQCH